MGTGSPYTACFPLSLRACAQVHLTDFVTPLVFVLFLFFAVSSVQAQIALEAEEPLTPHTTTGN
jgi:hypothetical protein